MAAATIKLVNTERMIDFYVTGNAEQLAKKLIKEGCYKVQGTMGVPGLEGEAVAEEVFDLTNNPSRQQEREAVYGHYRSVSVGDIVNVDGQDWLCCSEGWWALT